MSDIHHRQGEPRYSVCYGQMTFSFYWTQANIAARRKAVIHVHPNGEVEVQTQEGTTLAETKRARWVIEYLDEIHERQRHVLSRDYVSGETLLYLGRCYVLKLVPSDAEQHVKLLRGQVRETGPVLTREQVRGPAGVVSSAGQGSVSTALGARGGSTALAKGPPRLAATGDEDPVG
jgi:hypothetical protein